MLSSIGEYAVVAKVNVSNIQASLAWYVEKLGMQPAGAETATWAQLAFPGHTGFTVGLNLDAGHVGSGGANTTFVVRNIEAARNELISKGVDVSPISQPGDGVSLAFFKDPDGNELGLRQN